MLISQMKMLSESSGLKELSPDIDYTVLKLRRLLKNPCSENLKIYNGCNIAFESIESLRSDHVNKALYI